MVPPSEAFFDNSLHISFTSLIHSLPLCISVLVGLLVFYKILFHLVSSSLSLLLASFLHLRLVLASGWSSAEVHWSHVRQDINHRHTFLTTLGFSKHCFNSDDGVTEGAVLQATASKEDLEKLFEGGDLVGVKGNEHLL